MDTDVAAAAAHELYRARVDHRTVESLSAGLMPATVDDGYAVQAAWSAHTGWEVVGWKIGCTSRTAQEMLDIAQPFAGRVFAPFLHDSPVVLPASDFAAPLVEGEFAFTLGRDLPPRTGGYQRAEVEAVVDAVRPAIEIVATRFADFAAAGAPNLIADCGANGALVVGPPITAWRDVDLAATTVTMHVDGTPMGTGTGTDVLGHPLESLTWLANHLSDAGIALHAGQVVTTGTCTGAVPLAAGSTARTDHGVLGAVEVTLSARD